MEQNINEQSKIINLSKKILSTPQTEILARGLKFIPTPRRLNLIEIKDDTMGFFTKNCTSQKHFTTTPAKMTQY